MSFASDSRSQVVPRTLLVVLRAYLGVVLLVAGWGKLWREGGFAPRLAGMVERNVSSGAAHGFYQGFLEGVVLPNAGVFAALVILGEVLGGLALLTGTATRLAAAAAGFMMLNFMFLKGRWFWMSSSNDAAFFFIALIVMLGAAGRAFGVDYYLVRRWPKVKLW